MIDVTGSTIDKYMAAQMVSSEERASPRLARNVLLFLRGIACIRYALRFRLLSTSLGLGLFSKRVPRIRPFGNVMFACCVGGMESLLNFERKYETQLLSSKEHRGGGTWGTSFRVRHSRDCWYHTCTDGNFSSITSGPRNDGFR